MRSDIESRRKPERSKFAASAVLFHAVNAPQTFARERTPKFCSLALEAFAEIIRDRQRQNTAVCKDKVRIIGIGGL